MFGVWGKEDTPGRGVPLIHVPVGPQSWGQKAQQREPEVGPSQQPLMAMRDQYQIQIVWLQGWSNARWRKQTGNAFFLYTTGIRKGKWLNVVLRPAQKSSHNSLQGVFQVMFGLCNSSTIPLTALVAEIKGHGRSGQRSLTTESN